MSRAEATTTLDERYGRRLYEAARANAVLGAAAELLSLSGDEMVWWFPASAFITFGFGWRLLKALTVHGLPPAQLSCAEEVGCDIFGTAAVAGALETLLKSLVRRERPAYAREKKVYSLPGERWSFPSGHALRAAFLAFWATHAPHAALLLGSLRMKPPPLWAALVWAVGVGLSRVAKGRHYPVDVAAGLGLGAGLGLAVETKSRAAAGWAKVVGGILITGMWGCFFLVPIVAKATGLPPRVIVPFYFAFYGAMLSYSLPATAEEWNFGACF
mmetsp:Transcript_23637/g.70874  ORF Transcript_23637/g.70874 Transcript_23637/m.70874 type:complete len:272 (-) Transcript_23637:18-833(-)